VTFADFGSLVYALGFITPKTLNYLSVQSYDFERHLVMVVPETRHAY
jgi:hypothetical protein